MFPRYGMLGNGINHVFPYGMGGVLRGCGRSHPLLSALFVCEVPLDILYPRGDKGDRGGLSAVADDVDLRGSGWIGVVSVCE